MSESSTSSLSSLSSLSLNNDSNGSSNSSGSDDDSFDDAMDDEILGIIAEHCVEMNDTKWGGSLPGKAPNKARDFQGAYTRLLQVLYFQNIKVVLPAR